MAAIGRAYKRVVLHRRILVTLVDGTAFEGVLWDSPGDLLVLRGAVLHDRANGGPVDVDGEVLLDRQRISYVQALG